MLGIEALLGTLAAVHARYIFGNPGTLSCP